MAKSPFFLRLIILYKFLMGIFELVLSVHMYRLFKKDPAVVFTEMAGYLSLDRENIFVGFFMEKAEALGTDTVLAIIIVIFLFGVFNEIEAWGLHLKRRWAEWLTVCATGILIPFELYEFVKSLSPVTFVVMVINTLIVYYLARHKELFKSRSEEEALEEGRAE